MMITMLMTMIEIMLTMITMMITMMMAASPSVSPPSSHQARSRLHSRPSGGPQHSHQTHHHSENLNIHIITHIISLKTSTFTLHHHSQNLNIHSIYWYITILKTPTVTLHITIFKSWTFTQRHHSSKHGCVEVMIFLHTLFHNMSGLYSVSSYLLWESLKYYLDDLVQKGEGGLNQWLLLRRKLVRRGGGRVCVTLVTFFGHKYIQRSRHLVNKLLSGNGADGGTQDDADPRDLKPAPFTTWPSDHVVDFVFR